MRLISFLRLPKYFYDIRRPVKESKCERCQITSQPLPSNNPADPILNFEPLAWYFCARSESPVHAVAPWLLRNPSIITALNLTWSGRTPSPPSLNTKFSAVPRSTPFLTAGADSQRCQVVPIAILLRLTRRTTRCGMPGPGNYLTV
jgi:hypothetical protein